MTWQNRIVGAGTEDPEKLIPHPKNWRKHPKGQAQALEGAIEEIGWIQDIIINQRTGRMIDGHLRAELAIKNKEKVVPVKYVDLSEEEEEKALLTLDPISMMAEADKDRLSALLQNITSDMICLDPFLGSGTTLIACEQLDRICFGMEIAPAYTEISIQRWEKLTGQTRIKIGDLDT